jgi:excisionase family DNA binding protein
VILLDMPKAATFVGVSRRTVYEWIRQQKIPFVCVGVGRLIRFDQGALERWIERGKRGES